MQQKNRRYKKKIIEKINTENNKHVIFELYMEIRKSQIGEYS